MSEMARSSRVEVRNPLLALPEVQAILARPLEDRKLLGDLCAACSRAFRAKAEHCWKTRKPPMAAYWASWAVMARHAAAVLRRRA